MPEPEHSGAERHTLAMTQLEPGLVELQLISPSRGAAPGIGAEPSWSLAVKQIVESAFAGRNVCFVAYHPPIAWSDLQLEHLTGRVETLRAGELDFRLGFAERVSRAVLAEAAESQDFRHGGLLIAAIAEYPSERIRHFLAALEQAGAHFPEHKEWIRLPRDELEAMLRTQIEAKLRSNQEWIECVNDGEQLNWYHPQPAAFSACRAELDDFVRTA